MTARSTKKTRDAMADPLAAAPTPPQQPELEPRADDKPAQLVAVYGPIEKGLALMLEKHGSVLQAKPVVTVANLDAVRANHRELVTFRTTLEAVRKAEKEESLRYGQKVDAEAKRIQAIADPIERVYKTALDDYAFAEQQRKDNILKRISELRQTPQQAIGKTVEQLQAILEGIDTFPLAELQEFREQGAQAQLQASQAVRVLLKSAQEAQAAREAAAAAEREALRLGAIRTDIAHLRAAATQCRRATKADTLERLISIFKFGDPQKHADKFAELLDEATQVYRNELAALEQLLKDKRQAEADAQRLADQQRELDSLRAQLAAAAPPPTSAPTPAPTHAPTPAPTPAPTYSNGAPMFSTTTLKDNGDPIMLDPDGKRSVFCDVADGDNESAQPAGEPEAAQRLPREGGLFRVTGLGQDSAGAMHAELSPANAGEAGVVRVTPDPEGPGVIVEGMSIQTDVGLMPAPPDADEVIEFLAAHYDDHPFNIVQMLASFDYPALAEKFR